MLLAPSSSSSTAMGTVGMFCGTSGVSCTIAGTAVAAGTDVTGFLVGAAADEQRPSSHVVPAGHWEQAGPGSIMEARAKLPAGP